MYVTNQPQIVAHAKMCYRDYPTIVNNIGKDSTVYSNTPDDFAALDSKLAKSQRDIGESSNLAQIAQTYASSYDERKFDDYVCILSVIAQIAIDSAKRIFAINTTEEISRIKKDMDVDKHLYPLFWKSIKKGFNTKLINRNLICPMNELASLSVGRKDYSKTIPMKEFLHPIKPKLNRKPAKRIEGMIEKYSFQLHKRYNTVKDTSETDILLRSDFNDLIEDIRTVKISSNYSDVIFWLIDRAFGIVQNINRNKQKRTTDKNKPLLLKVLYEANKKAFLDCFVQKN